MSLLRLMYCEMLINFISYNYVCVGPRVRALVVQPPNHNNNYMIMKSYIIVNLTISKYFCVFVYFCVSKYITVVHVQAYDIVIN